MLSLLPKDFRLLLDSFLREKGTTKLKTHSTVHNNALTSTVVASFSVSFLMERVRDTSAFELPEVDE
jgi:hypothetical protein